jgi:hypothetical protein
LFIIKNVNIIKLNIDEKNLIKIDSEISENENNEKINDNIKNSKNDKKEDSYLNILLL